jgi:hypothetical protein
MSNKTQMSKLSIPNPQFNWGELGNESLYFFSLCLCAFVAKGFSDEKIYRNFSTKAVPDL